MSEKTKVVDTAERVLVSAAGERVVVRTKDKVLVKVGGARVSVRVPQANVLVRTNPQGPPGPVGPSGTSKPVITRSISEDLTVAGGDTCLQQEASIEPGIHVVIEPGGRMLLL